VIRKKSLPAQQELWVARQDIKAGSSRGYYDSLSELLDRSGFGDAARALCAPYYSAAGAGRPPLDPEVYFKMLFVGFFEGVCSERATASRCEDSISIRRFLGYDITEATPDHSTLSRVRTRLPAEVFEGAFDLVLSIVREAGFLEAAAIGNDSSTMEADASMEALVNRLDHRSYWDHVRALAADAGIDPEDGAAVRNFDKGREGRKTSNKEWVNPHDRDAKVGRRKDGAFDMIHKAEHTVDLESGAVIGAVVLPGDQGDAEGFGERMVEVAALADAMDDADADTDTDTEDTGTEPAKREVVADTGYHQKDELETLAEAGLTPVIPAPKNRKLPDPEKEPGAHVAAGAALEACGSERGKKLLRERAEKVERSFAHILDSGGMRRTTLRGLENINKRYKVACAAFNLSVVMRKIFKFGTVKQYVAGNGIEGASFWSQKWNLRSDLSHRIAA